MTKKNSEFSKTLEELDEKVSEINSHKKVIIAKDKRLQKVLDEHEEKIKALRLREEKLLKKAAIQNYVMFYFIMFVLVCFFVPSLYRKDPVNFWSTMMVILCVTGMVIMKQMKK